jgi:putative ABC transport system ATP-binding protein
MTDLELRDVVIEYSSAGYAVRPIDGLTRTVHDGQLALLLGASGCGKTTLLSAIAGILTPKSGSMRFGGNEIVGLSGARLTEYRRRTVGIVFQAFNLVPSLTALENVAVPLLAGGTRGRPARARAAELLERVGLADRVRHRPSDLSGGQRQRVAIARALAFDPPLMLADEPTAHLDFIQVESILELLRDLAQPGRVVVVATHDERLLPLADGVVELTPRTIADRKPAEHRRLEPGEVLFRQGDTGDRVYVVETGEIELYRELAGGGEELIAKVAAGQYFGELAPMFGLRRSASARAAGVALVTGYSLPEFRERFTGDEGGADSGGGAGVDQ